MCRYRTVSCLPEDGAVIVVLTNREVRPEEDFFGRIHGMLGPLVDALRSG
jgi:hypothetical protein